MAYNPSNNSNSGSNTKSYKAAPKAQAAQTERTERPMDAPTNPVGKLTVRMAGSTEYVEVGGLFERTSQKGRPYFGVKDKDGNVFQIWFNDKKA